MMMMTTINTMMMMMTIMNALILMLRVSECRRQLFGWGEATHPPSDDDDDADADADDDADGNDDDDVDGGDHVADDCGADDDGDTDSCHTSQTLSSVQVIFLIAWRKHNRWNIFCSEKHIFGK